MPVMGIVCVVLAATALVALVAAIVLAIKRKRKDLLEVEVSPLSLLVVACLISFIAFIGGRTIFVLWLLLLAGLVLLSFFVALFWERESGMSARSRNTLMLIVYVLLVADVTFGYRYWWRNAGKESIRFDVGAIHSDMRSVGTVLEVYYIDNETYPPAEDSDGRLVPFDPEGSGVSVGYVPRLLTTPVAYLRKLPLDRFSVGKEGGPFRYATNGTNCWMLASPGPDKDGDVPIEEYPDPEKGNCDRPKFFSHLGPGTAVEYDPSNGARSSGDIVRVGP